MDLIMDITKGFKNRVGKMIKFRTHNTPHKGIICKSEIETIIPKGIYRWYLIVLGLILYLLKNL